MLRRAQIRVRCNNRFVNRRELQDLARIRLSEAKALLRAGFPDGAYYLAETAERYPSKTKESSAVGFAAVADTGDLDDVVVFGLKQDPIVSANGAENRCVAA